MIKFTRKQLLAGALVALNILVLTPTGWMVGYLWTEQQHWRKETDEQIEALYKSMADLRADVAITYATRLELQSHSDRINDRLINVK